MSNFELNAIKVGVFPTNSTELLLANHFVRLEDESGTLVLGKPDSNQYKTLGVLYLEDAKLSQTAAVVVSGYVPVYAGATVAALDELMLMVDGKVKPDDGTSGAYIVGQAVTGGDSGELITVQVYNSPAANA